MDTTGFFQYPGNDPLPSENPPGFLEDRDDEDWTLLLEHTETRLFRAGQEVLTQGERDRALYLLVDGRLDAPSGTVAPVSTFGEVAFLGHEAFLALSARRPDLGRAVLTDVSAILAARLRHASDQIAGWTG